MARRAPALTSKNVSGRTLIRPLSRNTARGASRIPQLTARPHCEVRASVSYCGVLIFFFFFFFVAMICFLLV